MGDSTRFNILYLHETARIGGAEISLLNLAKRLDRETFDIFFILPEEGLLSERLRQRASAGVELLPLPSIRTVFGFFSSVGRIRNFVRDRQIKLIHSNSIRTHIYAAAAGKLEKVPVVWHERNLVTGEVLDPDRLFSFMPDRIICNSDAIAARFMKSGRLPARLRVVYNGVDTDEFNPGIDGRKIRDEFSIGPDEVVVGIASRFNRKKGHETFFMAAKDVIRDKTDLADKPRFLVAGSAVFDEDKRREEYLRGMAYDMGIGADVIFTGFRDDMPEVYAAMDILILASDAEPFGRVTIEAMAAGKPLIATDSGGTPEIVKDGISGFLFEPGDSKALADKIVLLAGNPALAGKMGEAGRRIIEEDFSIERHVRQIEKVYLELIRQGHGT